jgi:predicted cupin superfamily sugar epimerase
VRNEISAEDLIARLDLERHPEGGWFRETYRASEMISGQSLPARFSGDRASSTAIYFLLAKDEISAFHRIKSDELWHFYGGATLTVHTIASNGEYQQLKLGRDLDNGEFFQATVLAGVWFGAEVSGDGDYSLVGCTVAPGFDFSDFEMGDRAKLLADFPAHEEIIARLTRSSTRKNNGNDR